MEQTTDHPEMCPRLIQCPLGIIKDMEQATNHPEMCPRLIQSM